MITRDTSRISHLKAVSGLWVMAILLASGTFSTAWAACDIAARTYVLNEVTLHFSEVGEGDPIVMLHGLFAERSQWHEVGCALAAQGYRILVPDLPGFGQSRTIPISGYRLENQVSLLDAWLTGMGVESFHLGGNSMGGAIATLYAARYPGKVKSLAIIGGPMGVTGWHEPVRNAIYNGINPFIPLTVAELELEMKLLFARPFELPAALKQELVAGYSANYRQFVQVWDLVSLYHSILLPVRIVSIPVLVVWGEQDSIFAINEGLGGLRRIVPEAHVVQLPETGHLPMVESPREVGAHWLRFLGKRSHTGSGAEENSASVAKRGAGKETAVPVGNNTK